MPNSIILCIKVAENYMHSCIQISRAHRNSSSDANKQHRPVAAAAAAAAATTAKGTKHTHRQP